MFHVSYTYKTKRMNEISTFKSGLDTRTHILHGVSLCYLIIFHYIKFYLISF